MKKEFKKLSEKFNQICWIAQENNEEKLKNYLKQNHKTIGDSESIIINSVDREISPVFVLAYQNEVKAVDFLLRLGAPLVDAFCGYALAGNYQALQGDNEAGEYKYFKAPYPPLDEKRVGKIAKFLIVGVPHYIVSDFYKYLQYKDDLLLSVFCENFADELIKVGISRHREGLLKWLLTHFELSDSLLYNTCSFLSDSKSVSSYNPTSLMQTAYELSIREYHFASKIVNWPSLYVWLWQGPRLMRSNKLPLDIFIHVASFLCVGDDASFLAQTYVFEKTKQLFLSSLKEEDKLVQTKQKRSNAILIPKFSKIINRDFFRKQINDEVKSQQESEDRRQSTMLADDQSNLFVNTQYTLIKIPHHNSTIKSACERCSERMTEDICYS